MEIEDLVAYVNEELKKGLSTSKIEKNMKVGKDTIRKKLNRAGYAYNTVLQQYVLKGSMANIEPLTQKNTKSYEQHEIRDNTISDSEVRKDTTQGNTMCYEKPITRENTDSYDMDNLFTNEEIAALKQLAKQYIRSQIEFNVEELQDKEIITRSFRSYKEMFNKFANYCKKNNINQVKAVAIALQDFINKK